MPIAEITPQLVEEIVASYPRLAALNLSSNQIRRLENLDPLVNLSTLDLRDNQLTLLEGLGGGQLPELRELNVSGNRISHVACGRSELLDLDLGNNRIAEWPQVQAIGAAFPRLRSLVLHGNPICQREDYREEVRRCVPGLQMLDNSPVILRDHPPSPQQPGPTLAAETPPREAQGAEQVHLGQALRDAEQQISRLGQKVGKLEASNFQLQERLEDAQMQVDEADERTTDTMVLNSDLEATNGQLRHLNEEVSVEKIKLEDALQQTTSQLEMLAAENQALQQQIDTQARKDQERPGREQSATSEELTQLRSSLAAARQANDTLTDEVAQLESELSKLDLRRNQDSSDATAAISLIAELEQSAAASRAAIEQLEAANRGLVEHNKQLKRACEENDAKVLALGAENASLQTLLSTSGADSSRREADLKNANAALQAKLDEASSSSFRDRTELAHAREQLVKAEQNIADVHQHAAVVTAAQQQNKLLQEQVAQAEMRASQVGEVLEIHEQSLVDAECALENAKHCIKQNEDLKDENAALMARVEQLADARAATQAEVERHRADEDAMRERLRESEHGAQSQLVELTRAQASFERMEQTAARALADKQSLEAEVEKIQTELNAVNERASTAADELSVARTSLQGAEVALEASKAGVARIALLEGEVAQLRMQLGQERDAHQAALQQLHETEHHAAAVTESLDTARSSLEGAEKLLEQSKQLVAEKSELKRENEEMRAQWNAEREENKRIRVKLEEGHRHGAAALVEAEKHAVEAATERQSFAARLKEAQESLASMAAENSALRGQVVQTASSINAVVEASQKSFQDAEKNLRTVVERSFESSAAREESARLKAQVTQAQGECSTLRSELSEADAKAAAVSMVLETTSASLQSAEQALLKSREQSRQLAEISNDNHNLVHQIEAAVAKCEACEHAQAKQEHDLRTANEEVSRLRWQEAELRKQTAAAATESQQEITRLQQRIEQMETTGSEVNVVLDVTKASLEQAERSLLSSKQQSSSIQVEMQSLEAALHQAETERAELRKELRTADSSRQQAQHKLAAANAASSRDRAELQQLRQHIARTPGKPQPIVPVADAQSDASLDAGRMEQDLSLLSIRVESMEQVLRLQEQELSNHEELISDAAKHAASDQLLRNWRDKVLALLVQQKSTDIVHRQELAACERHERQLRDELTHMRTKLAILAQGEVNLKAEADRARNKQLHAEELLQKAVAARDEMASAADIERKQLGQLASQVRTKYLEMEALERRLQTSTVQLQEYSSRVESAAGKIGAAQEEMARSLEHRRQDIERLSAELSAGKADTETAKNRLADAEHRAKDLAQALEHAQNLGKAAQDELSAAKQTAAAEATELNSSIVSKVEEATHQSSLELAAAQRQLQQVKREHSKSLVALRTLERQVSRGEETRSEEAHERERELTETLRRREEQLTNLRAERNMLVATIRQTRHEADARQRNDSVTARTRTEHMVDRGAQTPAALSGEYGFGMGSGVDRMRRLQEQEWWERRQLELEREIALLRDEQQHANSADSGATHTARTRSAPPYSADYELDADMGASGSRSQMAAEAKRLVAEAAALELEKEAALLGFVSDTDSTFGSSDGSSGDSGYSSVDLGARHLQDSTDSDTTSDSDSSTELLDARNVAPPRFSTSQMGMSQKQRLEQLSLLSSDLLADD